jgi:hypothetical protein
MWMLYACIAHHKRQERSERSIKACPGENAAIGCEQITRKSMRTRIPIGCDENTCVTLAGQRPEEKKVKYSSRRSSLLDAVPFR